MDVSNIQGDPDPEAIAGKFKPDGKTYVLAARISGPAKNAFPDGAPAPEQTAGDKPADAAKPADAKPAAPGVKERVKPINVLMVAGDELRAERYWARTQPEFGTDGNGRGTYGGRGGQ